MNIQLMAQSNKEDSDHKSVQSLALQQLKQLLQQIYKGCNKIFHKHGYMNVKGDAPYDFTCDSSHRCSPCSKYYMAVTSQINKKQNAAKMEQNKVIVTKKLQQTRNKYFKGKPNCKCIKDCLCEDCFDVLQQAVNKYEKGCGKQWIEQVGGMAAGPGTVTCGYNYYSCDQCSEQLDFINKINKSEYPNVKVKHKQGQQLQNWNPRNCFYYANLL